MQRGTGHAGRAADHGDATAIAFVHRGMQSRQPRARPGVGHEYRPRRVGRRQPDVHDDELAAPLAGDEVAAAWAAEGDRHLGAHRAVGFAAREIEPGGAVDGEHRGGVRDEALRHREDVAARGAGGPGAEQRVYHHRGRRPRLVAPQLAHAVDPRQGAVVDGVVGLGIEGADPHGDAGSVQGAGQDPAVAAVVPCPRDDERAARHHLWEFLDEHAGAGAARRFHEHAARYAVLRARRRVPARGLGRGKHGERVHGITTPPYPTTALSSPVTHPECR